MDNMMHNSSAFYGFDRSASAVNGERVTARISKGLVFFKAKVSLTKFRLAEQINRTLSNSGFFFVHRCRTPHDSKRGSRRRGRSDVMQSCESRGRGAKSQIVPDERSKKGYMRSYWITQKGSCRYWLI